MSLQPKDKIFISIGGLAIVLTSVWAVLQEAKISALDSNISAPTGGASFESKELKVALPESQTWAQAGAQPAGENWIYNVFTPPKIYYNTQTKQFTVIPPPPPGTGGEGPLSPPPPPPRTTLELVKVNQPLFRLQLVGYIGGEGNYRGTFNNELTGKTFFGTSGKKVPDLNLEIVTFEAKRQRQAVQGASTLVEVTAYAIVKDLETGKEYRLDHDKRLPEGPVVATLKLMDGSDKDVKTGDTFTSGESNFKVGAITLQPPSVAVTRQTSEAVPPVEELLTIPPPPPPAPPALTEPGEPGTGSLPINSEPARPIPGF